MFQSKPSKMVVICDQSSKERDDTEDYEDNPNPVLNNPNRNTSSLNGTVEYETVDFDNYTNLIVINMNDFNIFSKLILVFDRRNKSSVFSYHPLKDDKRQALP